MLACNEVTRLWASEEIRTAPLSRRLAVRFHLMMCEHCRRYVRELALIGAAARSSAEESAGSEPALSNLERRLIDRIRRPESPSDGGPNAP
jgi:predicted anti-sigma-YlaC factor YlaD